MTAVRWHIAGFGLDSDCPSCHSDDVWFEIGKGDKPRHLSVRLNCRHCGYRHKQDVYDPDHDELENIVVIDKVSDGPPSSRLDG